MLLGAILLSVLLPQTAAETSKRAPAPIAAEQAAADKLLKDVFKAEYAKRGPADKLALAKKLLAQGEQTSDDLPSKFVLFREARELAAQVGDMDLALAAIDALGTSFEVDVPSLKLGILTGAAKAGRTPEDMKEVAELAIKVASAAAGADDFATADKAATLASQTARRAQDAGLVNRSNVKSKEVADLKSRFERVKKARGILAGNTEDPAANLTVGSYECLVKGNWAVGLPKLAKGSDSALKAAASADLRNPTSSPDQTAAGDGWWDLGEKEPSALAKELLCDRAFFWYEKSFPALTGLVKARVEKRLNEVRTHRMSKGDWLDVTSHKLWELNGFPGDPFKLEPKAGFRQTVTIAPYPKGEFDGLSARVILDPAPGPMALLFFDTEGRAAALDARAGKFILVREANNNLMLEDKAEWTPQQESTITVLLANGEYILYLDGREMIRMKTADRKIVRFSLSAWNDTMKFDRVRMRRIS